MKKFRFIRIMCLIIVAVIAFTSCGGGGEVSEISGESINYSDHSGESHYHSGESDHESDSASEHESETESGNNGEPYKPVKDPEPEYASGDVVTSPASAYDFGVSEKVEGTTHICNMTKTADFIVRNKTTDYKILLPEEANDYEEYAATELKAFIQASTGLVLQTVTETDGGNYSSGKYLSIGETALKANCGTSFDYATLGASGFKIVTSGKSIIMSGADKFGTLYAVYEFLHRTIGWETYSADCVVYDKNVKNIPLYNYDITEVPDIPWRQIDMQTVVSNNPVLMKRLRFNSASDVWAYPGGWCHNSFHVLDPSDYFADHKNWYSRDIRGKTIYSELTWESDLPAQLCYSQALEDEEMMSIIVETLEDWLVDSPDVEMMTFSQQDNKSWCQCSKCTAAKNNYGTDSAQVVKFLNKLYQRLEPWLNENGRNLILSFFAYNPTVDAPAVKQGNSYVAKDDSVKCLENVAVMYAPIEADYSKPLTNEANSREYENLMKWKACSSKVLLWYYSLNTQSYLAPYNTFDSIVENYRLARNSGAFWLFDQQQKGASNSTGFWILKYYLEAKLSWNVNLDVDELIDDFFDNYFGEAAEVMKKLFDEVRARMKYVEDELHVSMYIWQKLENKDYWQKGLLQQWLGYIDEAKKVIAHLAEDDEDEYSLLYDRILLEGISYRFLLIDIYGNSVYDSETLLAEKMAFKNDCAYLKVDAYAENGRLSQYMNDNW